jgi:hypothetical protein
MSNASYICTPSIPYFERPPGPRRNRSFRPVQSRNASSVVHDNTDGLIRVDARLQGGGSGRRTTPRSSERIHMPLAPGGRLISVCPARPHGSSWCRRETRVPSSKRALDCVRHLSGERTRHDLRPLKARSDIGSPWRALTTRAVPVDQHYMILFGSGVTAVPLCPYGPHRVARNSRVKWRPVPEVQAPALRSRLFRRSFCR